MDKYDVIICGAGAAGLMAALVLKRKTHNNVSILILEHKDKPGKKLLATGNGRCKNLTEDNLCAIYDKRPEICNVSKMYKLVYREYMSQEEYLSLNIEACEKIKRGVV